MALLLGIDTGGTFTDAAILETSCGGKSRVVAKAKALTTRQDLAIGIEEAARAALQQIGDQGSRIALVSLSTTLATNALVEKQGGRIALVSIGFSQKDLDKAGLRDALDGDPVVLLEGGHTTHGQEATALDMGPLEQHIDQLAHNVTGFAVAGYFAVRNPSHELLVRELISSRTGLAVTCSHELSARLNGPKRALTTVLNARLVPMIARLLAATQNTLSTLGIAAPVMVVRGDGALVSADFAARRPIETILSGPAASLIGARFLTGADNAMVCDIGGTTSDVALLKNGSPLIAPDGAIVGGYRTMVEAVAMKTFGLGGDSEVGIGGPALQPEISLGPRRIVPVCLIGKHHKDLVHAALDRQLRSTLTGRNDGRFAFLSGPGLAAGLSSNEEKLLAKLTDKPVALEGFLEGTAQTGALNQLVSKGLVQVCGVTPSDAMHVLGHHDIWDREAALKALKLFARRRDGSGNALHSDPQALAQIIVERVQRRTAEVVLETAFDSDGQNGSELVSHSLVQNVLDARCAPGGESGVVRSHIALRYPLIGLGASAHEYHPPAAQLLGVEAIVPDDAGVANAIGAVVGHIAVQAEVTITQPSEGQFRLTGIDAPLSDEVSAFAVARETAKARVQDLAVQAGAGDVEISVQDETRYAEIEGKNVLIEARIVAKAAGRPPLA